jgi:hypothetical protein
MSERFTGPHGEQTKPGLDHAKCPARGADHVRWRMLGWPLASIPIYYWRGQSMLEGERIRTLAGGRTVAPRKH